MSNRLISLLLAALCGGCVVVPKTTTTTRDLGTSEGEVIEGAPQAILLETVATGSIVTIKAAAKRECERPIYRVTEVKREKHARMRDTKDPRAAVFGALLAPVTLPISAVISGFVVLADGSGNRRRDTTPMPSQKFACTSAAPQLAVVVALPSGATLGGTTDAAGRLVMTIPETEPYRGTITARAALAVASEATYARATPPITAVREAIGSCAARHGIAGTLELRLTIDEAGMATRIGLDVGDGEFAACVNNGIAGTRFPAAHRGATLVLPFAIPTARS
ncbi:MAG: hypothetical protein H0T89_12540 [Deltaproteobacteria bacterium]|nr:hypothetical protein [Deltaproteobacteria bacterium]MDQ3295559.1 hypothetical protein [Myxococcota bacterium]